MKIQMVAFTSLCLTVLASSSASGQIRPESAGCSDGLEEIQRTLINLQAELQMAQRAVETMRRTASSTGHVPVGTKREPGAPDPVDLEEAGRSYEEGKRAEDRQRCAEAIPHFTRSLSLDRSNDAALLHRGSCRYQMGDFGGAMTDLDECLRIQPNNGRGYAVRALIHSSLNQLQGAISDFTEVITRDGMNSGALSMRGSLYHQIADEQRALADLTKAATLSPTLPHIYVERAKVYRKLRDLTAAMRDCARARDLNAQSPEAHLCLAETYLAMGQLKSAADTVTEALRLDPNLPGASAVLASVRGVQRFESFIMPPSRVAPQNGPDPAVATSTIVEGSSMATLQPGNWVGGPVSMSKGSALLVSETQSIRAAVIIIDGLDEGPRRIPYP